MAGCGAGRRGQGSVLPAPLHQQPPARGCCHSRLGSPWLQAGSKRCQQPKATLQASHGLSLQTMQCFLQYFPSRASLKRHIICIQSEKPHFVMKTLRRSVQRAGPRHVLAGHQPLPACFVPALQQVQLVQTSQQSLVSGNPIL